MPKELLTHSRLATFRLCPRKHQLRYELGLARETVADCLRLGGAFHDGLDRKNKGANTDDAINQATAGYDSPPEAIDPQKWNIERVTVRNLLAGHCWRYEDDDLDIVASELPYQISLVNPDTGASSRTWDLAGKIDAIVRLPDGRLAVLEYKTVGYDIGPDSDYWLRLRGDSQISMYMIAAMTLGHGVVVVLYDATRKPTIRPCQVPLLDDAGCKIVIDADGVRVYTKQGKPRQTGSKADGWELQSRTETSEEFGERLLADIGERPDYYYQRREVPRMADDLRECQYELWQQSQAIIEARRHGRWFRNVSYYTCPHCEFAGICLNNVHVGPDEMPSGFTKLPTVHPELEGLLDE